MKLIFIRHGEPDYSTDSLTENGKKQAADAAKRLEKEGIKAIYASPMGRARETAGYTAKALNLDVNILDYMHEIDWGDRSEDVSEEEKIPYNGHPWTLAYKLLTENPEYVNSSEWAQHPYFKNNKCLDYYEKVSKGLDDLLSEYGLVRKNGLYSCSKENNDTIALFAHGGSGAILFSHILSLPFPFVLTTMPYGVCSVSVISFNEQQGDMVIPRLELFDDMGHIEAFKEEKLHFDK